MIFLKMMKMKKLIVSTLEVVKVLQDWENRTDKYKIDILETLKKMNPSQQEIDEMEKLLHID
jgi:hypothetical protein